MYLMSMAKCKATVFPEHQHCTEACILPCNCVPLIPTFVRSIPSFSCDSRWRMMLLCSSMAPRSVSEYSTSSSTSWSWLIAARGARIDKSCFAQNQESMSPDNHSKDHYTGTPSNLSQVTANHLKIGQVPNLQMICSDLIKWQGTRLVVQITATRVTYPIFSKMLTWNLLAPDLWTSSSDLKNDGVFIFLGLPLLMLSQNKNMDNYNHDFQMQLLIGCQQSCQPIRSHIRKSWLVSQDFILWKH